MGVNIAHAVPQCQQDSAPILQDRSALDYRVLYSFVLGQLHSQSQVKVARKTGLSESRLSRMKATDLEDVCKVLAALDLIVVDVGPYEHTEYLRMVLAA